MNRRMIALAVATILSMFATQSEAEVVFDNGAPDQSGGYYASSNYPYTIAATRIQVAPSGLAFNGMNWWGGYDGNSLPGRESFTLSVFNPAMTLLESRPIENLARQATGFTIQDSYTEYAYGGDFAEVALSAGDYFIGLSNAQTGGSIWFWEKTSLAPIFGERSYNTLSGVWSEEVTFALAFQVTQAVPEIDPATGGSALSLVAGVLAMIEQRRRRAAIVARSSWPDDH